MRLANGMEARAAAEKAGISPARWTQVETGYESRRGRKKAVSAGPGLLARMAHAVGLDPERLAGTGREDAAEVLREIYRRTLAASVHELLTPQDAYEREVAATPGVSFDTVQRMIRRHRELIAEADQAKGRGGAAASG